MNRFYQGRVSMVKISDGKDEWKKLDAAESALFVAPKCSVGGWQHHDAVNFCQLLN